MYKTSLQMEKKFKKLYEMWPKSIDKQFHIPKVEI